MISFILIDFLFKTYLDNYYLYTTQIKRWVNKSLNTFHDGERLCEAGLRKGKYMEGDMYICFIDII